MSTTRYISGLLNYRPDYLETPEHPSILEILLKRPIINVGYWVSFP